MEINGSFSLFRVCWSSLDKLALEIYTTASTYCNLPDCKPLRGKGLDEGAVLQEQLCKVI